MGQVYLGRSPGERPVAVKVVRPELAADAAFRRRFAVEVEAARRVGGFYTAQVVDANPDPLDGPPWLATAYIEGPSLQQMVVAGPLPPGEVIALGAGLAEGLAAIHNCGLVHRDLKPSNVILARDGPRVIDFGIVRALDESSHTVSRGVFGTPAYMSPEQARGHEVGPPSDVFSLGAVLTFAATGHGPFGSGPAHAIMYRIIHDDPVLAGLPARLRGLITACLAKDPGERPTVPDVLHRLAGRRAAETGRPAPPPHGDVPTEPDKRAEKPVGKPAPAPRFAGGFGFHDVVDPAERCPDCGSGQVPPTDLFCRDHDRLLALVDWGSARRAGVVLTGAALAYALFWLAGILESPVPALLAAAAIGMLAYLLPLRTHRSTRRWAVAVYALAFGGTLLVDAVAGAGRRSLIAVLFSAATAALAVHGGRVIHADTGDAATTPSRGTGRGIVEAGAISTVVAMVAGLGWLLIPLFLNDAYTAGTRLGHLLVALAALVAALGIAGVAGVTEGVRRVRTETPRLARVRRPRHVSWSATFIDVRRGRPAAMVDRLGELATITAIRIVDLLRIVLVTTARVAANALADLSYLLVLLAIEAINLVIKAVVVAVRAIIAVAARFAASTARFFGVGLVVGGRGVAALGLPAAALVGAAILAGPLSEHLRNYMRDGGMNELWLLALHAMTAFALISAAWVLSAYQRVHLSLLSLYRSVNVSGPHLLVFIALSGWLSTVLSLLGLGDVRAGWATWTATAILMTALVWAQIRRHRRGHDTVSRRP